MTLLKKSIENAFKNILRNKLINVLCLSIITFTLFIYGIFNFISLSLDTFTQKFSKNVEAIFYFHENVSEDDVIGFINREINSRSERKEMVKKLSIKSQDQAERDFLRQFPELEYILNEFDSTSSPFPSSIEIKFKKKFSSKQIMTVIQELSAQKLVESRQVNIDWAEKVNSIRNFISLIGIFLSGILLFVSVFIIYNVIRLNVMYRQEEIEILKLVGATNWYIEFPFIIEGAILGLTGSISAALLLIVSLKIFPSYAGISFNLIKGMIDFTVLPPFSLILKLILIGTVIGTASSFVSLRNFFTSQKDL